ncbi:serine/threonine-protein kinase [Rhodoferax sp.]|uniref:serine/threonine protein kinase n=1 Tax=Rhodoferax sp. TaxID=50421 RepID=UPI0025D1275E|nr:serine/threonine-protein kinase [Rhodoferax sp.]
MVDQHAPSAPPQVPVTGHLDALAPGTRLAEFEIKGLLGVGGFGMVYRGYDHSLHRAVAIKEYMPTSLAGRDPLAAVTVKSATDSAAFESGLRSFIAEARLLARFDHPSLVKVYRFWEANNTAYMAMPLYEGITLKEARRRMSGPPPQAWLQSVLWSVLAGLKVLHDNSTLHRDVSPDNIFLQNIGPPVLLDLGAARRAILDTSQKHTAVLKVNYAPIEQYADARDMQEGPWTDLYAVAAVMHGCICNEPPLPATFRAVRDRLPPFAQVAQTAETHFGQTYSDNFVRAIAHALVIEPAERTPSVEALAQEIGMKSPPDLARFDWRKALGESVTLTEAGDDPAPITTEMLTTRPASDFPDTVFQSTTLDSAKTVKVPPPGGAPVKARRTESPTRSSAVTFHGWWIAVGLLLAVLAWWALRPAVPQPQPMLTERAAPEGLPAQLPAVQAGVPEVSPPAPQVAPPAKAVSGPLATSPVKPAPASRAVAANPPAPAITEKAQPAKAPLRPEAGATAAAEKPSVHSTSSKDPLAACAEASVFSRTMCVYRECQKPEFYNLPVCVADRKHWDEQNKNRN